MAGLGLPTYRTPNQLGRAQKFYGQASGSYGAMMKERPEPPGKSAGGALQSGASMAMAGGATGAMIGGSALGMSAGPLGAVAGGVVGLGSYLLS